MSLWGELIPRELENTITSVPLSEEYTFSIDPYYAGYNDVVNRINAKLGNYNNGNLDIDWFDVLDILSVQIQHQFVCEERSNYYVFHEKDFYPSIDQDYDKKLYFYDDPCAQMDNSAKCSVTKCSVTNIVAILRDVKWYNSKFKVPIHMKGATLGNIIIPAAQGWLQVQTNTKQGYLNMLCFYSPHFTSFLLSDRDILRTSPHLKQFSVASDDKIL